MPKLTALWLDEARKGVHFNKALVQFDNADLNIRDNALQSLL